MPKRSRKLSSKLSGAAALLRRLRQLRRGASKERYRATVDARFGAYKADPVVKAATESECTCVLKQGGRAKRFPGATEAECSAAASEYGLEWEWVCNGQK